MRTTVLFNTITTIMIIPSLSCLFLGLFRNSKQDLSPQEPMRLSDSSNNSPVEKFVRLLKDSENQSMAVKASAIFAFATKKENIETNSLALATEYVKSYPCLIQYTAQANNNTFIQRHNGIEKYATAPSTRMIEEKLDNNPQLIEKVTDLSIAEAKKYLTIAPHAYRHLPWELKEEVRLQETAIIGNPWTIADMLHLPNKQYLIALAIKQDSRMVKYLDLSLCKLKHDKLQESKRDGTIKFKIMVHETCPDNELYSWGNNYYEFTLNKESLEQNCYQTHKM